MFRSLFRPIKLWLQSEKDAVPLALILLSSPQLPLTTLRELQAKGFYTYLPGYEALLTNPEKALRGLSDKMRRVLEAAVATQRSGRREALEEKLRDVLAELRTALDLADYNVGNMYMVVSTFVSTIAGMIVSTLALMGPGGAMAAIVSALSASLFSVVVGVAAYPIEYSLPTPPAKSYLSLASIIPLYLLLSFLGVPLPLTLSIALGSIFTSALHFVYVRRQVKELLDTREMVRVASRAVGNPYRALKGRFIENPEDLIRPTDNGLVQAVRLALFQVLLHGGYEFLEKLEEYYSRIVDFILRLRSKTRVFLIYAVIESVIVSMMYAILVSVKPLLFGAGTEALATLGITSAGLDELEQNMDLILSSIALALSVATSSFREGKPTLFTIYMPVIAAALYASFMMALAFTPSLFR
ncbi:hypothetical protein [Thermofilum sp.]|uniref:hypothetical protein n=1 Tax=Thermofilum sp. TaxID=1961369 RepID=UPI00258301F5|nr:hypothetical protein [Thermofilum sp.]